MSIVPFYVRWTVTSVHCRNDNFGLPVKSISPLMIGTTFYIEQFIYPHCYQRSKGVKNSTLIPNVHWIEHVKCIKGPRNSKVEL